MPNNWNDASRVRSMVPVAALTLTAMLAVGSPTSTLAAGTAPTVVELFTSQGCSSCPPANANLIELSQRPGVLALSFAVTYWDYLGWKDTFDKPEFTDRQVAYEPPLDQQGPYTPQMVINGASTVVGNNLDKLERAIANAKPLSGPTVSLHAGSVNIGAATSNASADVWLVRYDPNLIEVPIARGENTGRTLPHTHVVHDLERIGSWSGTPVSIDIDAAPSGLKTAVLVQTNNGGAILGAASD